VKICVIEDVWFCKVCGCFGLEYCCTVHRESVLFARNVVHGFSLQGSVISHTCYEPGKSSKDLYKKESL
jgi:hypothetical protein